MTSKHGPFGQAWLSDGMAGMMRSAPPALFVTLWGATVWMQDPRHTAMLSPVQWGRPWKGSSTSELSKDRRPLNQKNPNVHRKLCPQNLVLPPPRKRGQNEEKFVQISRKSSKLTLFPGGEAKFCGQNDSVKGRKKTINQNFCGRKWPVWSPFLTPKIPPKKFMWVPFFASFARKWGT